jgi:hypothetical protein
MGEDGSRKLDPVRENQPSIPVDARVNIDLLCRSLDGFARRGSVPDDLLGGRRRGEKAGDCRTALSDQGPPDEATSVATKGSGAVRRFAAGRDLGPEWHRSSDRASARERGRTDRTTDRSNGRSSEGRRSDGAARVGSSDSRRDGSAPAEGRGSHRIREGGTPGRSTRGEPHGAPRVYTRDLSSKPPLAGLAPHHWRIDVAARLRRTGEPREGEASVELPRGSAASVPCLSGRPFPPCDGGETSRSGIWHLPSEPLLAAC